MSYMGQDADGKWDPDCKFSYVVSQTSTLSKTPLALKTINASYIAVCSGLHVLPEIPKIPGIEHVLEPKQGRAVQPAVYHSHEYKSRDQLAERRVMILGTGETGMDLAYEAAKTGAEEVVLCSRGG